MALEETNMEASYDGFTPMPSDDGKPKDSKGNVYRHCLDLNDRKFWCHLVIDEDEWKVFENDDIRIQVIWNDKFDIGSECEITFEHKNCDDPKWHGEDDYEVL
jgi:hypothetical protein